MEITVLTSNEQALAELGGRLRDARIDTPLTQEELARKAGVSLSTVASIERGGDARLGSWLSILRALGMLGNADALVPTTEVRPSEIAELGHRRQRARSAKQAPASSTAWVWGDER